MDKKNPIQARIKLPFKKSHAFIIGINEYYRPLSPLKTAINDAEKLAEILAKEQGFNVHSVLRNAKREEIRQLLEETMPKKIKAEDRCLLHFAGHGIAEEGVGDEILEGYLIPADAVRGEVASYYAMKDLYAAIRNLPCRHFLLILDCCYSGSFKWAIQFRNVQRRVPKCIFKENYDRFVKNPAWQVITSAASDQQVVDYNGMEHSPFAKALFEGLQGEAGIRPKGKGDGLITATELYLYLRDRVEPQTIAISEELRQTPAIFPLLKKHDKGEYVFLNPRNPKVYLPTLPPGKSPYKGLLPFEEGDANLFYGRERIINELTEKIKESNFIAVTGSSGSGKSSVVKAGLLPELRKQGYDIRVIRPGKTPIAFLEKALKELKILKPRISLSSDMEIERGTFTLKKAALIIDQYEELITMGCKEVDRNRFVRVLKILLESGGSDLFKIILTVSADFLPQRNGLELEANWQKGMYGVPPLNSGELREIILMPAEQAVIEFESSNFVETIFEDFDKAPGALPLLSFTLDALFRSSLDTGKILRKSDYKELGDQESPLYKHTDKMAGSLSGDEKKTFRKMMMRFVSIKGNKLVGRKVSRDELDFSEDEKINVGKVINKLLRERLIVEHLIVDTRGNNQPKQKESTPHTAEGNQPGKEESAYEAAKDRPSTELELAHPALIEIFKKLEFLPKDQEIDLPEKHEIKWLELQNSLADTVKEYRINKDKDLLWYRGHRFKLLKNELESPGSFLNKNEVEFARAGIKLKKQKIKNICATAVSVIIILSFLSIFAFNKARTARANHLASQAQLRLESDPAAAISLAKDAYLLDPNKNVTQVLSAAAAQTLEHPLYNLNLQHDYDVNTAVFSPSGNKMLTASEDKTAKLWDIQGKLLHEFKHENAVTSAVFSPDDHAILTVSRDKAARLWNLQGQLLQEFRHEKTVNSAEFSPDGQTILTASDDNTARLWNLQGECLKTILHRSDVNVARYSPDGTRVLTLSRDLNAWVSDIRGNLINGVYPVTSADFSSQGKYIVFILFNNTVKLWNLADNTGKVYKDFKEVVQWAAVTPGESSIIIAYLGGTLEILNFNGQPPVSFGLHKDTVTSVVFSPDGTRLLTTSNDRTAKLWDLSGRMIADLYLHKGSVINAAFSPDGTRVLTASRDETAKVWDLKDQLATRIILHREEVSYAAYSPDGTEIITISGGNNAQLWDRRGNPKANLNTHTKTVHTAVFSPDGTRILTASADNTAKLWNLEGDEITDFNQHTDNVNSAVFSPDGRTILTASYDDTARLWDLQGNVLQTFKHRKDVISARYSPDGRTILTASFDETAKLWDLQGNLLTEFNKQYGQVKVAIFSPDGTKILTVSASARLWEVKGKHLVEFNILKLLEGKMRIEESHSVTGAEFSPDSKSVLTVYSDNTARLWDLEGKLLMQMDHREKIYSACFSPNGTWIVTASGDSTVKLWDLHGNLWAEYDKHKGDVYSAVFSPDGSMILSASADKTVMLRYTPEGIIQWLAKTPHPSYKLEGNSNPK